MGLVCKILKVSVSVNVNYESMASNTDRSNDQLY
jgi:hypothetical protein